MRAAKAPTVKQIFRNAAHSERAIDPVSNSTIPVIYRVLRSDFLKKVRYQGPSGEGVNLRVMSELADTKSEDVIESLNLMDSDGMGMGYHGWLENDFGDPRPFVAESEWREAGQ